MRTFKILIMAILAVFFLFNSAKAEDTDDYVIRVKISELILVFENERQAIKIYRIAGPASSNPYPLPLIGRVISIEIDPAWYPTAGTIEFYKKKGIDLPAVVKPGDTLNAMGKVKFVIEFENWHNSTPVRIHGTNNPSSIEKRVSRGMYQNA